MIVIGIMPTDHLMVDIFNTADRDRLTTVSRIMDKINRQYGRNTVMFAVQKTRHP